MDVSTDSPTDASDDFITAEPNAFLSQPALPQRYILTWVGQQPIAFPSQWVAEIILVERSKILSLPFYPSALLGVIHHKGSLVPLVMAEVALEVGITDGRQPNLLQQMKELLTVIRLSQALATLPGVGLVVDRVIGSMSDEQLSSPLPPSALSSPIHLFQPEDISPDLWQPR